MRNYLAKKYDVIINRTERGFVCVKNEVDICFAYSLEMLSECLIEVFGY